MVTRPLNKHIRISNSCLNSSFFCIQSCKTYIYIYTHCTTMLYYILWKVKYKSRSLLSFTFENLFHHIQQRFWSLIHQDRDGLNKLFLDHEQHRGCKNTLYYLRAHPLVEAGNSFVSYHLNDCIDSTWIHEKFR